MIDMTVWHIACPPRNKEDQLKIGIRDLQVPEDHKIVQCDLCGIDVWIGPKQQAHLKENPHLRIHCFGCSLDIVQKAGGATVRSLGGKGGKYITAQGKIFAEGED